MTAFLDSSAIVKLYVPEEHHEAIRATPGPFVISALAVVEVPAAFWRKHRIGDVEATDAATLSRAFRADVERTRPGRPAFELIAAGGGVLDEAARLVARYPLKAYDAMQLAAALAVQQVVTGVVEFGCFDRALRAAAAAEGLHVIPDLRPPGGD